MLSTVIERVKALIWSPGSDAEADGPNGRASEDDGPGLYECKGCGAVFISRPEQCSTCEDDDFTDVGKFE